MNCHSKTIGDPTNNSLQRKMQNIDEASFAYPNMVQEGRQKKQREICGFKVLCSDYFDTSVSSFASVAV